MQDGYSSMGQMGQCSTGLKQWLSFKRRDMAWIWGHLGHLSCTPEAEGGVVMGETGLPTLTGPEQLQVHLFYILSFS